MLEGQAGLTDATVELLECQVPIDVETDHHESVVADVGADPLEHGGR